MIDNELAKFLYPTAVSARIQTGLGRMPYQLGPSYAGPVGNLAGLDSLYNQLLSPNWIGYDPQLKLDLATMAQWGTRLGPLEVHQAFFVPFFINILHY